MSTKSTTMIVAMPDPQKAISALPTVLAAAISATRILSQTAAATLWNCSKTATRPLCAGAFQGGEAKVTEYSVTFFAFCSRCFWMTFFWITDFWRCAGCLFCTGWLFCDSGMNSENELFVHWRILLGMVYYILSNKIDGLPYI